MRVAVVEQVRMQANVAGGIVEADAVALVAPDRVAADQDVARGADHSVSGNRKDVVQY